MVNKKKKTIYLICGFLIIILVYSLYNIFLVDVNYFRKIPRRIRHINKLVAILMVYAVGTFTLKKYTVKWMMQVWHTMHMLVISLMLLLGFYDWTFGAISLQLRNIANTLLEFLISPVFYAAIAILNNRLQLSSRAKE